jgi:hypothetical protein
MLAAFLIGSCVAKILSVSLAGRLAGFRGLDLINLALTTNARGGPGIVLDVALDPGIISNGSHTTLVLASGYHLSDRLGLGAITFRTKAIAIAIQSKFTSAGRTVRQP